MAKKLRKDELEVDPLQAILKTIQDNLITIVVSIVVIAVLVAGGFIFNINKMNDEKLQASEYATALDIDDAGERATALAVVAEGNSKYSAEALLLQASAAMDAEDYDAAKAAYANLLKSHPDFEFTPDAEEGLGLILMAQSDYAGAITHFEKVTSTWPDSFTAKRQPFNIGQCHEKNGDPAKAVTAYEEQLVLFDGSRVALQAQQKLNQLYIEHPELETPEDLVELGDLLEQDILVEPEDSGDTVVEPIEVGFE